MHHNYYIFLALRLANKQGIYPARCPTPRHPQCALIFAQGYATPFARHKKYIGRVVRIVLYLWHRYELPQKFHILLFRYNKQ